MFTSPAEEELGKKNTLVPGLNYRANNVNYFI